MKHRWRKRREGEIEGGGSEGGWEETERGGGFWEMERVPKAETVN